MEDKVVKELLAEGLIQRHRASSGTGSSWRSIPTPVALAAGILLMVVGFGIGRLGGGESPATLTGAETDLYALLLFETEDYIPTGTDAVARYGEYSSWVAEARRRRQFVTGQALEVERGWLVSSADGQPEVQSATSVGSGAPLGGLFFIQADSPEAALELAESLPHVRYGGSVLVQKTVPTDQPPEN